MRTHAVYIAADGRRFDDQKACEQYEADGCVEFSRIPKYCDHVPITDQTLSWMITGDGSCYYATATRMSRISAHPAPHPKWATHLVYFGK
jgi:hypothetical protein